MENDTVYVTKNSSRRSIIRAYPSIELARRSPEWNNGPNEKGVSADSIEPITVHTEEDIERLEERNGGKFSRFSGEE